MTTGPRVAFFTDSFYEVNGVALTSRQFEQFARESDRPMFSCHAGPQTATWTEGSITRFEWARSRAGIHLEVDLSFDLLFWRIYRRVREAARRFGPDLVHITAPGESSLMGIFIARELGVPIAASWHTNLHEFGARRLDRILTGLPNEVRRKLVEIAESGALDLSLLYYRIARLLFAPNPELIDLLAQRTGRPVHMMSRGVDSNLFTPDKRNRQDDIVRLGYVGRVSPEKNVDFLAEVERALIASGVTNYEFVIIGHGSRCEWLKSRLQRVRLTGVLHGEELAREYAALDVFVFPSRTDTFGNVVLEAMASGVPAIVTGSGGPQYLVEDGETGYVARDDSAFSRRTIELTRNTGLRLRMAQFARLHATKRHSWHSVFQGLYHSYQQLWSPAPSVAMAYHEAHLAEAHRPIVR